MDYEEKKEVKKEKVYNLYRCGYLEVRDSKFLPEPFGPISPTSSPGST